MEPILFAILGGLCVIALQWLVRNRLSFGAQRPEDYENTGTDFDIRQHLNGPLACDGVIYGPTGRVSSRFTAEFDAEWDGDECVMRERFLYDSGNTQLRAWHLSLKTGGQIDARADDVVGTGQGSQKGSAVHLRYSIKLPEEGGGHVLDVVDWMFFGPGGTIVNRSQFRKFGIKVAELVATVRPDPARLAKEQSVAETSPNKDGQDAA